MAIYYFLNSEGKKEKIRSRTRVVHAGGQNVP
jgi:hypothetical protein